MVRVGILFAAICALSIASVFGHEMDPDQVVGAQELGGIVRTISTPFLHTRTQRNQKLDELLDTIIDTFKPVVKTTLQIRNNSFSLCCGIPAMRQVLLSGIGQGVGKFSSIIGHSVRLSSCSNHARSAQIASLIGSSQFAQLTSSGNGLTPAAQLAECKKFVNKANVHSTGRPLAAGDTLGAPITCDATCVANAVGAHAGKHVPVEVAAQIVTASINGAMNANTVRYNALLPKIRRAGSMVAKAVAAIENIGEQFSFVADQGRALKGRSETLMSAFLQTVTKLDSDLAQIECN